MDEIRRFVRVLFLLLAVGLYLTGAYYIITGIIGDEMDQILPAIFYLLAGLLTSTFEKILEAG
jgi:L-lactate permease